MSGVISSALISVGSNFAYDILKSFNKYDLENAIDEKLNNYLAEFEDLDTDSHYFEQFLKSESLKADFKEYFRARIIIKSHHEENYKFISKETFIGEVTKNAINYVKDKKGMLLRSDLVNKYFERIFEVLEYELYKNLDESSKGTLYFLNDSLKDIEERIIKNLSNFKVLHGILEHEETINKYLEIMSDRNRTSHVYGIDELDLYSFYVFPKFKFHKKDISAKSDEKDSVDWKNIFVESNIISIIGGAGFGKTLFLRNIINKYSELNIFDAEKMVPIYCDLKKYKEFENKLGSISIEEFIRLSIIEYTGMNEKEINLDLIKYILEEGKALILLDALDEVEINERDGLNAKIISFFKWFNQNNKVCITSREIGFTPKTRITYRVQKINLDDVEEYISKMGNLNLFNSEDKEDFKKQCIKLIKSKFLVSFLQLSLLINIFKAERELPENKIDLYDKCIDYISKKREREFNKSKFNFKKINPILNKEVTFEKLSNLSKPNNKEISKEIVEECLLERYKNTYACEASAQDAISEFLDFCSQRTELYVSGEKEETYKFYHRSFFEYFYAKHIISTATDEELLDIVFGFSLDSEIFELTSSLLKKYNDNRYLHLLELLNSKLDDLDDIDSLLKVFLFLKPVDEINYLEKFYNTFFENGSKRLSNWKTQDDNKGVSINLLEVFFKYKEEDKVMEDLWLYYSMEILHVKFLIYFIDLIDDKKNREYLEAIVEFKDDNKLINYLDFFFIVENKLINTFIKEHDFRDLKTNFIKYLSTILYFDESQLSNGKKSDQLIEELVGNFLKLYIN